VGIGVANPVERLEVAGNIRAGTHNPTLAMMGSHPNHSANFAVWWRNGSEYALLAASDFTAVGSPRPDAGFIGFRAGNVEYMWMDAATGHFGIGAYPGTHALLARTEQPGWGTYMENRHGGVLRAQAYFAHGGGYGQYLNVPNATPSTYYLQWQNTGYAANVPDKRNSFIINGSGNVGMGAVLTPARLTLQGDHNNTQLRLFSDNFGQGIDGVNTAVLTAWASEPGVTWSGAGIGNNVTNTSGFPRLTTTRGGSYIRMLDNNIRFSLITAAGVNHTPFEVLGTSIEAGNGSIRIGNHTLQSHSNGWIYMGNGASAVYGGTGLATERIYIQTNFYLATGSAAGRYMVSDANGIGTWQTVNYAMLPRGTVVGLCVCNTNANGCNIPNIRTNGNENCTSGTQAPITGWNSGCPAGYSWTHLAANWNGADNRWTYACVKD
jgi:hypothetical protein